MRTTIGSLVGAREVGNAHLALTFDGPTGALAGLRNRATGTQCVAEPGLAESFRLLVPLPGRVCHYVFGAEQPLCRFVADPDGVSGGLLEWGTVRSDAGEFPITVRLRFQLSTEARCTVAIENRSPHTVEEVWAPILGGLRGIGRPEDTVLLPGELRDPWRHFPDEAPNYGYPWPARYIGYPRPRGMLWLALHNGREGLYVALEDASGATCGFHLERHPYTNTVNSWLPADVPSGFHIAACWHPFIPPGATWESPVAVLWPFRGDWHVAADRYRAWLDTWFRPHGQPAWVADFLGWQHTIMATQSDAIHHRYGDIPRLAAAAAGHGYPCINLVGFHRGGIERNYPDFGPDERLGGEAALRSGIAGAHAVGTRVLLFSKSHRADANTAWSKEELWRYAVKDRDGAIIQDAYGYDTLDTRIRGQKRGRFAVMCPAEPGWQDIMVEQTLRMARYGADGTQYDQICNAPYLCYDPSHASHAGRPDLAVGPGLYTLLDRIEAALAVEFPDFLLSGEEPWDALYQWLGVGYTRHEGPLADSRQWRYVLPQTRELLRLDAYDFDRVNLALLLGCGLDFEILRWRGSLADAPELAARAAEMAQLRRRWPELLIGGRFRDCVGAEVEADASVEWSVLAAPDCRRRAVVFVNPQHAPARAAVRRLEGSATRGPWLVARPGQRDEEALPGEAVLVPPHGAAVVVPEAAGRRQGWPV